MKLSPKITPPFTKGLIDTITTWVSQYNEQCSIQLLCIYLLAYLISNIFLVCEKAGVVILYR